MKIFLGIGRYLPLPIINFVRRLQFLYYRTRVKESSDGKLIILGCGRSGTTYTSKLFISHGISIGHEKLLRNGISSWYLVSSQKTVPYGPSFEEIKDLHMPIVHQVRHPLRSISSMMATGTPSWEFLAKEIPISLSEDSRILRAMKYWYHWNLLAEEKAKYTYQVENLSNEFDTLLKIGGFNTFSKRSKVPTTVNSRPHKDLQWKDLEREDPLLFRKIVLLGEKYGYHIIHGNR